MIALLLACAAPTWTPEGALAPHLARLDRDHDGHVTAAEYEAAAWNGPPFPSADADHDGELSAPELVRLHRTASATAFDHPGAGAPLQHATEDFTPTPAAERAVEEVLVALTDALRAAGDPSVEGLSLHDAVRSASLESPASKAVLDRIRPAWLARGWTWPVGVP